MSIKTAPSFSGSLLDRLTNRSNDQIAEATLSRGELQASSLRESIIRNLEWLLNTTRLDSRTDLSRWPHVQRSVLNFGIPELAGHMSSGMSTHELEQSLTEAIRRFEPRLAPETISVEVVANREKFDLHSMVVIINGDCQEDGITESLQIHVKLDSDTGKVSEVSA